MATQLELTEQNVKLLQDIKKLSKERNKLTGVTTGKGLTQFKFFADKVQKFNEYRDNTAKVFNFLTGKAKRDEKALAESQGIDVEQLRKLQKDSLVQASLKEQFQKQVELQKSLNTDFEKYFDKLSDDQKELLQKDEKKFTELFQTFTQTAANKELTDTERNNKLTEAIEKVISNANENTNKVIQGNKQNTQDTIDNENENISDAIDRESIAGRQANKAFGASLVQAQTPITPITPEVTVESKGGLNVLEFLGINKAVGIFRRGILRGFKRASLAIFGKGFIARILKGLRFGLRFASFAFMKNPYVLGVLSFIYKDEISKLIGMTFKFLGEKILAPAIDGFKRFISNIFPFSLFMDENDYLTDDEIKSKQEFQQRQREYIQKLTNPEVKFVDPATIGRNEERVRIIDENALANASRQGEVIVTSMASNNNQNFVNNNTFTNKHIGTLDNRVNRENNYS